ncbi:MAG: hypothetical protein J5711_02050 [Bacteroidales bacterium]|nr:hypothetical protein [Bacteroidales bacterium]
MRKLFYIAAVALLTLGTVSCQKEDSKDGSNNMNTDTTPNNPTNPMDTTTTPTILISWVDLGLPSGLLWAECNLGATTPEEYGNYYAWGETWTKRVYTWTTYFYGDYDSESSTYMMSKYNTREDYGTVDNKTTLEPSDDAATVILGNGARIPTEVEWRELLNNTTSKWTTVNNVHGRKFTATNGNSLFLPAAGNMDGSGLDAADGGGFYWTSSLAGDTDETYYYPNFACALGFNSGKQLLSNSYYRYYGFSVRAVRSAH